METFKTLSRCVLISILLSASFNLSAQFSEDFSDKELQNSPSWTGDLQDFEVNEDLQLQLNAAEPGISYIVTPSRVYSNAVWELYFRFDFNPSSQNFSKIYLTSDGNDLTAPVSGYFVMIGANNDDISLYREESGLVTKLIDGEDERLNTDGVSGKIKISRSASGKWELWTALSDTSGYIQEGEFIDERIQSPLLFGIYCQYTSTRATKFYFDDIKITGDLFEDSLPPALLSVKVISPNQVEAVFSEPLPPSIISQLNSFEIKPLIGSPHKIEFKEDPSQLNLFFENSITEGEEYLFTAVNVADISQNISPSLSLPLQYFTPHEATYRSVVINEIMPDPTPVIGLPEAEFVEIYNCTKKSFDLTGWTLSDNTKSGLLGSGSILPGEHVILCAASDSLAFTKFGKVHVVSGFPSLNNDSDDLFLRNAPGDKIDEIYYTKSWYNSSLRNEGGYSLEMIDYAHPCSSGDNWKVSEHQDGGTPGEINSIQSRKPDNAKPKLKRIYPATDSLLLTFNEALDPESIKTARYVLNDNVLNAEAYLNTNRTDVIVNLEFPLEAKTKYTIVVENIQDCNGNFIDHESNSISFSLPESADSVDILINEILFNPNTGGADFVEIYNNSEKYINLKDWNLGNIDIEKESGKAIIANRKKILDYNYLFPPQAFLVLTADIGDIHKNYPGSVNNEMVSLSNFPSYPDDEGSVVILNEANIVIDKFDYHEDYHSPIISKQDGVALERIAYDSPTQDFHNWTSAASTAGFATPGAFNSQSRSLAEFDGSININPKVIIPNSDGSRDFTTIQYLFGNKSYIGNVYVFDINGNRVSTIAENQSFSSEGFLSWEGTSENGDKLDLGIYMVFIEIFDFDGTVKVYKEPIAIGSNF